MNEKVKIVEGKIIETLKPNEIYLALFDQGSGWQISGVMYHTPDEVAVNLAAFNPKQIVIVKVEMPEVKFPGKRILEESKVDETKIVNNMRCCKCKLMKKPWEIVCDNCGGTIYEGFYDKELDEGKPELIGVKVSPNGVEDILLEKSKIETTELEEAIADEAEKAVEDMTTKKIVELL